MVEQAATAGTSSSWLGFAGSLFGGGLGGSAPPSNSTAIAEGSTVTVGGLNVPAYPNFPLLQNNAIDAVQQPTITQAVNNNGVYLIAGAVLIVALLVKKK